MHDSIFKAVWNLSTNVRWNKLVNQVRLKQVWLDTRKKFKKVIK